MKQTLKQKAEKLKVDPKKKPVCEDRTRFIKKVIKLLLEGSKKVIKPLLEGDQCERTESSSIRSVK